MFRWIQEHYPEVDPNAAVTPMQGGLINATFALGERWILQRLHPIFSPEVNLDIAALTPILSAAGVPVPSILKSVSGQPWVLHEGATWRVLSRLDGHSIERVENTSQATAAGQILAEFHGALQHSEHVFAFTRTGAHDTQRHMDGLLGVREKHPTHPLIKAVTPLISELLERWKSCSSNPPPPLPRRVVHGDPKISNLLFDKTDRAVGVVDLDTMAWSTLEVELGDALRSWCSTQDENGDAPRFDLSLFKAATHAYLKAAAPWISAAEIQSIPSGVERICLELSARFAKDALEESYFGWDPKIAPSRGAHNLRRARNQLLLAREVAEKKNTMLQLLK